MKKKLLLFPQLISLDILLTFSLYLYYLHFHYKIMLLQMIKMFCIRKAKATDKNSIIDAKRLAMYGRIFLSEKGFTGDIERKGKLIL